MRKKLLVLVLGMAPLAKSYAVSLYKIGNVTQSAVLVQTLNQGKPLESGTAFEVVYSTTLAMHPVSYRFLITAKHVIAGADTVVMLINRNLNKVDELAGKPRTTSIVIPIESGGRRLWQEAADGVDIAVIYMSGTDATQEQIENAASNYLNAVSTNSTDQVWRSNLPIPVPSEVNDRIPDDELPDIFYSGYPLGLHSQKWVLPFTRRCTIAVASMQGIPLQNTNPNNFVIDCAPFEGDSGSPVFMRAIEVGDDGRFIRWDSKLVGVISGYVSWDEISKSTTSSRDVELAIELKKKNVLGLGQVAPAAYIVPAIEEFLRINSRR